MIRLIISFIILIVMVSLISFFPLFIPHIEYAGFFLMEKGVLDYEKSFLITYAEIILLFIMAIKLRGRLKDKYSKILILLPLSAIPSLTYSFFMGNYYASFYLFILLVLAVYYYEFVLIKMEFYEKINFINLIVLSLIVAGMFNKLYQGFVHGPELAAYMNPLLYGLISRGGGMNGSNHVGGILLVLLPLITSKKVFVITVIFLISCFSRGIYFVLFVYLSYIVLMNGYFILKKSTINKREILSILLVFTGISFLLSIIPIEFYDELQRNFINRLEAFLVVGENQRFDVFNIAIRIFQESSYIGVGPANFYYGFDMLDTSLYEDRFSNAHNLYLTLLVENGIVFLILFLYISLIFLIKAYKVNTRLFISLSIFMFYGLFSGQLYEAGMGKISLYDYYYYLFVIAFIRFQEQNVLSRKFNV